MAPFVTLESGCTFLVAAFDGSGHLQTKGPAGLSDETKKGTA
jgi:hypothetical protein